MRLSLEHLERYSERDLYTQLQTATLCLNKNSILLFHKTGTGKTISSLLIAETKITEFEGRVLVVAPDIVHSQFISELMSILPYRYPSEKSVESRYTFTTYESLKNVAKFDFNCIILDELHKARSEETSIYEGLKRIRNEITPKKTFIVASTATPVFDSADDLSVLGILAWNDGDQELEQEILEKKGSISDKSFKTFSQKYISYIEGTDEGLAKLVPHPLSTVVDDYPFPVIFHKNISKAQYRTGISVNQNFNNKIDFVVKDILSNPSLKTIVYSKVKTNGIYLVKKKLEEKGFKQLGKGLSKTKVFAMLTTPAPVSNTPQDIVKNIENIDVILITDKAATGFDVKMIRNIHVLEPWWNSSQTKQTIGRGQRRGAHDMFKISDRYIRHAVHVTESDVSGGDRDRLNKSIEKEIYNKRIQNIIKSSNIYTKTDIVETGKQAWYMTLARKNHTLQEIFPYVVALSIYKYYSKNGRGDIDLKSFPKRKFDAQFYSANLSDFYLDNTLHRVWPKGDDHVYVEPSKDITVLYKGLEKTQGSLSSRVLKIRKVRESAFKEIDPTLYHLFKLTYAPLKDTSSIKLLSKHININIVTDPKQVPDYVGKRGIVSKFFLKEVKKTGIVQLYFEKNNKYRTQRVVRTEFSPSTILEYSRDLVKLHKDKAISNYLDSVVQHPEFKLSTDNMSILFSSLLSKMGILYIVI